MFKEEVIVPSPPETLDESSRIQLRLIKGSVVKIEENKEVDA